MSPSDIDSLGLKTGEKIKLRKDLSSIMSKDISVASLSHMVPREETSTNPTNYSFGTMDDSTDYPTVALQYINQVSKLK